jgi:hypothetical protein
VPGTDDVFAYPNTYLDGSVNQSQIAGSDGCHGLFVTKITMGCDGPKGHFEGDCGTSNKSDKLWSTKKGK